MKLEIGYLICIILWPLISPAKCIICIDYENRAKTIGICIGTWGGLALLANDPA